MSQLRGVWLSNVDSRVLYSRDAIASSMDFLAQTGFNAVFPVVWNKALTLFPSKTMLQTFGREIDPAHKGRDPLKEVIIEAHRVGLKVIPWFEYGFVSSYQQNGGPLLAKKPEWAARDSKGNLLVKNGFYWMNSLDSEVQNFLLEIILEVVRNYDVDGIQGDDRFPALPSQGGYDEKTLKRYYQEFNCSPHLCHHNPQWLKWRADILTDFLSRLYSEVKAIKPNVLVSISPGIYNWCYREYLQDYPTWMEKEIVDLIHPQLYRRDFPSYQKLVDRLVKLHCKNGQLSQIFPGILIKVGTYRITEADLLRAIAYNREMNINGEILFFYEGLRENNDALAKALRQASYASL
ncbi:MAG: family 10 glycosylhydrolase [Cyanobacteriota bacterium]|nr:family 10 glycosylhydrolase [Cyanobacteriota bacterium]